MQVLQNRKSWRQEDKRQRNKWAAIRFGCETTRQEDINRIFHHEVSGLIVQIAINMLMLLLASLASCSHTVNT